MLEIKYGCFPGVPLLDGGTVRLPALIGLSRALDMILTGRPISAKEALSMGMFYSLFGTSIIISISIVSMEPLKRY